MIACPGEPGPGSVLGEPVAVAFHQPLRNLGRSDGLPSGQVHSVSADARGRLWVATPNGLAVADRARVTTFTRAHGLSTQGLRCLAVASDDTVWVGSDVGVDRRSPDGRIESLVAGWRWGLAADIAIDQDGSPWVASAQGLVRWVDGGWEREPHLPDGPADRVTVDGHGNVWLLSRLHGVLVRRSGVWSVAVVAGDSRLGVLQCVSASEDGTAVVGGSGGALHIDSSGRVVRTIEGLEDAVHAVLVARSKLWLATKTQLSAYALDRGAWRAQGVVAPSVRVNRITHDRHGNVWVATDSSGVVEVEAVGDAITRPVVPIAAVFCIRPLAGDAMLVAGDSGGGRLQLSPSATYQPIISLAGERVWDLLDDGRDGFWAATDLGLCHITDATARSRRVGADHPVLAAPGRALLRRGGDLWVGTLNGLAVVDDDGSVRTIDAGDGMPLGYVYTLVADGDTVWIGTLGNGLWRFAHHGAERVQGADLIDTGNTYAVAVGDTGSVAVLQDDRIVVIDGDQPPRLVTRAKEALVGWAATFDRSGRLWVGGTDGLAQYALPTGDRHCLVTLWMGLEGWEFTTSRALVHDSQGQLLCGVGSGLAIVDPRGIEELARNRPTVELAELSWSGVEARQVEPGRWEVPEGSWSLTAKVYSTFPFVEPTPLFRYRLLGLQPDWGEPTRSAEASYDRLVPGGYTLEAQAHSELAGWGPTATIAAIDVAGMGVVRRTLGRLRSARALRRLAAENHALEQLIRDRMLELEQTQIELEAANQALRSLSLTDQLTGVANRVRLADEMRRGLLRAVRTRSPFSVLVIDVDEFKAYNDAFGHVAGDQCLREVALAVSDALRADLDMLARYGGEEFVALLPDADETTALSIAERVRKSVQERALPHPRSSVDQSVTISVGCASMPPDRRRTSEELIVAADRALYQAKLDGRNRVRAAGESLGATDDRSC